jgi:hypothetical protein
MASQFRTANKWTTRRWGVPDHSNQLDLFSEAVPDTSETDTQVPPQRSSTQTGPRRPEQMRLDMWEAPPANDAVPVPVATPDDVPTRVDQEEKLQEAISQTATVAQHESAPEITLAPLPEIEAVMRVRDVEPEPLPSRDFRITPAHRIGEGSLQEKARDNVAAIRLLKSLEAEKRDATDEEKTILARYVGWGAMPNVFGYQPPGEWRQMAAGIKELLTGAEYESARASTPNAHFTSPQVIEAVWSGIERIGLGKGAQILEPAMGVGQFFGLMPESFAGGHRTEALSRRHHIRQGV